MTREELVALVQSMSPAEQEKLNQDLDRLSHERHLQACRNDLHTFMRHMWRLDKFVDGWHIRESCRQFNRIANGEIHRLMINMPPRHSKSEQASIYLPAWYIGKFPTRKIIQATHTEELSTDFGRIVRNMIKSPAYQEIFPGVELARDNRAAGSWNTNKGGEYHALGISSAAAGKGADLFVIDDAHSEKQALSGDPNAFDQAWNWFGAGPMQRLQPGGSIVVNMTRWSKRDLCGRIWEDSSQRRLLHPWHVVKFPAIKDGQALWPEFWSIEELLEKKASMPPHHWDAQYQQEPTAKEGNLILREWWQKWEACDLNGQPKLPKFKFRIAAIDTAYTSRTSSDFNACTEWGVFDHDNRANVMLINAWKERIDFPTLKRRVLDMHKHRHPDALVVESKANGSALIDELRSMGIPVSDTTPTKETGDKRVRMTAVSDTFQSKFVWYVPGATSQMVVDEVSDFPYGTNDDLADTVAIAIKRFRDGGFVTLPVDQDWDYKPIQRRRVQYY